MPFYQNPVTFDGGNYTVTRTSAAAGVAPTLAEIGEAAFVDGSVMLNLLPNGNVERWVVESGVPVLKNTDIGPRRFTSLPDPDDFNPATSETTLDGDVIEIWGQHYHNGYYECLPSDTTVLDPGPPYSCWVGRTVSSTPTSKDVWVGLASQFLGDGYISMRGLFTYAPIESRLVVGNVTTGEYFPADSYDAVNRHVYFPVTEFSAGDVVSVTYDHENVIAPAYFHTEDVAAVTWTIPHNLGFYPVPIRPIDGDPAISSFAHTDANTMTITFGTAFAGVVKVG